MFGQSLPRRARPHAVRTTRLVWFTSVCTFRIVIAASLMWWGTDYLLGRDRQHGRVIAEYGVCACMRAWMNACLHACAQVALEFVRARISLRPPAHVGTGVCTCVQADKGAHARACMHPHLFRDISQILNIDEVLYTAFAPLRLKLLLGKVGRLRCPAPSLHGIGIWSAGSLVCVTALLSVVATIKIAPQVGAIGHRHACTHGCTPA